MKLQRDEVRERGVIWMLAVAMAGAACGHGAGPAPAAPGPTTPTATGSTATEATPPDAPPADAGAGVATKPPAPVDPDAWMWTAGVVSAWRVPSGVLDMVAVDDRRAVVAMFGGRLATVDLASGAVSEHPEQFGGSRLTRLVRAGGRLLAYGVTGKAAAAWSVDPTSLVATPLPLAEPAAAAADGRNLLAVSPDGAQVFTCSADRWPALRDAATLTARKVFTGIEGCNSPRFVDTGHVLVERADDEGPARLLDLATGTATEVKPGGPVVVPGPGGRAATNRAGVVTVSGADGKAIASYKTGFYNAVWLDDGSAVVAGVRGHVTVLAAKPGQAERIIEVASSVLKVVPVPGTTRVLVQLGLHRLGVVDTASGAVTSAAGTNLGKIDKLAAVDGAVVSAGDRVRVWRGGQLAVTGERAVVEALDLDPGEPIAYATLDGVYRADPDTGATEVVDADASSPAVDRQGGRMAWDRDDRVMMQVGDQPPTAWLRRKEAFFIVDLDLATDRVAMNDDTAFYIARPGRRELFGFHAFDCEDPLYLWLERGRERAVSYDGVTVHLYDTAKRKGLGGLELVDDNIEAVTFIPGSDALAVAGEAVYLWDPVKRTVVRWAVPAELTGIDATAIGVDPSGSALAIGFADGAVLWATVAGLRAHATPVGADVVTQQPAAKIRCGKAMVSSFAGVLGQADDELEGSGDDE